MFEVMARARKRELGAMAPVWWKSPRAPFRNSLVLDGRPPIALSSTVPLFRRIRAQKGQVLLTGCGRMRVMRRAPLLLLLSIVMLPVARAAEPELDSDFARILQMEDQRTTGDGALAG